MNNLNLNIFVKSKLLDKPENILNISHDVSSYSEVIKTFLNYKKNKKQFDYEICGLFDSFINDNNHIIMYHSKNKVNTLLMVKYENTYKYFKIPYLAINKKLEELQKTNFIAYYK